MTKTTTLETVRELLRASGYDSRLAIGGAGEPDHLLISGIDDSSDDAIRADVARVVGDSYRVSWADDDLLIEVAGA